MELAHAASDGRLGLYVGAGVSMSTPTLLPTSAELVARLAPRVQQELDVALGSANGGGDADPAAEDPQLTLERLADAADAVGVIATFREIAASVVDFREAPAGYSHRAMAALLREGAVTVFSANWDRCIERGAAEVGFHIDPTITEADRAVRFANCQFHKIHGCAAQPATLLVTTGDLDTPPAWVSHTVGGAVGAITLVFVGLGTVGGYIRQRVAQFLGSLGGDATIWLADPFPSDTWTELLERADQHILQMDANNFFDDLLRAYIRNSLAQLGDDGRAMDRQGVRAPVAATIGRLVDALNDQRALELVNWLRAGAKGVAEGAPFLHSRDCRNAFLAVAMIASNVEFMTRGEEERLVLMAGGTAVEFAVWPEISADVVVERETARVIGRQVRHCYEGYAPTIAHICVGHRGPLPRPEVLPDIGAGEVREGDLVESQPTHLWIPAEAVLQGTYDTEIAA
jgi:hypothetical protein